jgi:hypothetical protein
MSDKTYVAVMKTTEGYFLMLTQDTQSKIRSILGWKSLGDATRYFEDGYNENHRRGYEASMSACMNYIQFQPRILEFNGLQDMIDKLRLTAGEKAMRLHSISGSYEVMKLDSVLAEPIYKNAVNPKLISGI